MIGMDVARKEILFAERSDLFARKIAVKFRRNGIMEIKCHKNVRNDSNIEAAVVIVEFHIRHATMSPV